jgi:hypothetical protein
MGKPLGRFTDRDEDILKERLSQLYGELTNLAELQRVEVDPDEAPAVRLNIDHLGQRHPHRDHPIPVKKKAQVERLMKELEGETEGR